MTIFLYLFLQIKMPCDQVGCLVDCSHVTYIDRIAIRVSHVANANLFDGITFVGMLNHLRDMILLEHITRRPMRFRPIYG